MDWFAHNAGFVAAAYILSGVCILALIIAVIANDRRRARELKKKD